MDNKQPILFGYIRDCLAELDKAEKEGRKDDETRLTFALPGCLLADVIILPIEVFASVIDKLNKLLPPVEKK